MELRENEKNGDRGQLEKCIWVQKDMKALYNLIQIINKQINKYIIAMRDNS